MSPFPSHPVVLVDAGDAAWPRIEPVVAQRFAELAAKSQLEVVVRDESAAAALVAWCEERGIAHGRAPHADSESGRAFVLHAAAVLPLEEL